MDADTGPSSFWRGIVALLAIQIAATVIAALVSLETTWFVGSNWAPWVSAVLIFCNSAIVLVMFFSVMSAGIGKRRTIFSVIIISASGIFCIIFNFGIMYIHMGITTSSGVSVTTLSDALYFSVVTWTTLGYGDIIPLGASRLVVIAEATMGYIVMALLIAAFQAAIKPPDLPRK